MTNDGADDEPIVIVDLRSPCVECGHGRGRIELRTNQLTTWCDHCGKYQYNTSRAEIGLDTQPLTSRRKISPGKRARVLRRYNYACVCCNTTDRPLHIGHVVPLSSQVADIDSSVLHHEMNLAPMCDVCNLGIGASPVGIALMVRLIAHWIRTLEDTTTKSNGDE